MISDDSLNQKITDLERGTILMQGPGDTWSYRKMSYWQREAMTRIVGDEIVARGGEYMHQNVKITYVDGKLLRSMR